MLKEKLEQRLGLKNARFLVFNGEITRKKIESVWQEIHDRLPKNPDQLFCLVITTTGGSVDAARNFYSKVQLYGVNLITVALGEVSSSGIIIFLAGKKRLAEGATQFMVHGVHFDSLDGMTRQELKNKFNETECAHTLMSRTIAKETNLSLAQARKLLTGDNFLTAKEAKRDGFVHRIIN